MNRLRLTLSALIAAAGLAAAALPAQAADLAGTHWRPVTLPGARPTPNQEIRFDRDRVYGHDGCNRFNGGYTERGRNGLRFDRVASTMMACIGRPAERASRALSRAMQETRGWRIRGDRLHLLDRRGRPIAVFRR